MQCCLARRATLNHPKKVRTEDSCSFHLVQNIDGVQHFFTSVVHLVVLDEGVRRALWFSFQLAGVQRLS